MRKKIYLSSVFLVGMFFSVQNVFSQAHSCEISSGPASFFSEYSQKIEKEIEDIKSLALSKNPNCNDVFESDSKIVRSLHRASVIFDMASARIPQMDYVLTDAKYGIKTTFSLEKGDIYSRDIRFFNVLEKKVESVAESLANSCGLNNDAARDLSNVILEIRKMKNIFQKISFSEVTMDLSDIRAESQDFARKIMTTYSPEQVDACSPKTEEQKNWSDKLTSAFNFGGKKEKMLETWKKASRLITSTFGGGSSVEYERAARNILNQELSRQGFTTNAREAMLRNFDCLKAETTGTNNIIDNMVARGKCLQIPIAGLNKLQEDFTKMAWKSQTTRDLEKINETAVKTYARSVDIQKMYAELQSYISDTQDTSDETRTHLINLHQSLLETNERIEGRIPTMQNNCMKGNPSIIGGCKE